MGMGTNQGMADVGRPLALSGGQRQALGLHCGGDREHHAPALDPSAKGCRQAGERRREIGELRGAAALGHFQRVHQGAEDRPAGIGLIAVPAQHAITQGTERAISLLQVGDQHDLRPPGAVKLRTQVDEMRPEAGGERVQRIVAQALAANDRDLVPEPEFAQGRETLVVDLAGEIQPANLDGEAGAQNIVLKTHAASPRGQVRNHRRRRAPGQGWRSPRHPR